MGKTGKDADTRPEKMDKKSKKSKNKTSDLVEVGDGTIHKEIDGDLPKENGHTHSEKKKKRSKSESKKNGDEDQRDKGNLVNDGLQKKDKKKKRKRDSSEKAQINKNEQGRDDCDPKPGKLKSSDGKGTEMSMQDHQEDVFEKTDKKKKRKTDCQNSDTEMNGIVTEESTLETRDREDGKGSKGKNKTKSVENNSEKQKVKVKDRKGRKKTTDSVENNTEKPKAKGKSKKVSFSGHVEVFPLSDTESKKQTTEGDGLVRGKRFTPEEDAIVKEAVLNYIAARDLGDEGLKMILNCNSHPGMKKCWQEIGTCIPYRPYTAVYYRAHVLFERGENRSWTPEEIQTLKEFHEKHGNNWKMLAEELGKHRFHVKDTWRRIKLENLKAGKWSQEEYQNLYDLVNLDLQMKVNGQEKKSKHGMLRDNIPWTAISEKLSTRSDATCCDKWYNQLTSSLVAEKKWSDADDYRMIGKLYELDAACVEDVDWDNLLEHRPGDICRKRWDQMVKHIGHQGSKPFAEQVDALAKRYCPDLAETRETWDNKPVVP